MTVPDNIILPSNLVYSPASISIQSGTTVYSATPTLDGTLPVSFSLTTNPIAPEITINSGSGMIIVATGLAVGTYNISVTATNAGGSATFTNVYTVDVAATAIAPGNLSYAPNSISITQGQAGSSVVPGISGTSPVSFSLASSPASSGMITINSATGVITASSSLSSGTYHVNVKATNSAGSTDFNNIYTITVGGASTPPSSLAYSPNSYTVSQGTAGTSSTPTISGTQPVAYTVSAAPSTSNISISSTGVISSNSSLATGTYNVSVTATNSAGNQVFSNIYTITVSATTASAITFTNDIKAIILSNCGNCHTAGGSQTEYALYNNAKTDVDMIIDRIQRAELVAGFMPKNGSPLTTAQINLIKQWKTDGLIE
jgi:hypothetical protein